MRQLLFGAALVCAVLLFFERPVQAYVDPGSGSMLLQLLLGGVAGLGVIVKLYWRRLADRFSGRAASGADERPDSK